MDLFCSLVVITTPNLSSISEICVLFQFTPNNRKSNINFIVVVMSTAAAMTAPNVIASDLQLQALPRVSYQMIAIAEMQNCTKFEDVQL